ncbi:MAG: response regulator [Chitinophagaceae bacterium]|nr:MAG: response regulator [Chitinophagaceae bacterium]
MDSFLAGIRFLKLGLLCLRYEVLCPFFFPHLVLPGLNWARFWICTPQQTTAIMRAEPIILWVDDDEDDLDTFRHAAAEAGVTLTIDHAGNGVEALAYLNKRKETGALPCLVILDMNMPQMDGRGTLMTIKANPGFAHLQVVVFTTSASPLDQVFCKKYSCEIFQKPNSFDKLKEIITGFGAMCRSSKTDSGR